MRTPLGNAPDAAVPALHWLAVYAITNLFFCLTLGIHMKAFATAAAALAATFALALVATDTSPADAAEEVIETAEEIAQEV